MKKKVGSIYLRMLVKIGTMIHDQNFTFKFITTHCQGLVSLETIGQKFGRKVLGKDLYKQEVSESFHFSCCMAVDLVTYIHILP